MFSNKTYNEVNREERHFCTLFVHALITSELVRKKFTELMNSKITKEINAEAYEIYTEVAVLRDFWRELGCPKKYLTETHKKRLEILNELIKLSGYEGVVAIDDPIFKTINEKICYPGKWSERILRSRGLLNLNEIKWAFNSRPDIMIITSTDCIMIETKIVSNEGKKSSTSYSQYQIQRFLGKVMKALIPQFSELEFHHVLIDVKHQPTIYWKEIIEIIRNSDIDSYTKSTFELLDYRINQRLIF